MARNKGGLGPGAAAMGGKGMRPMRPPTAMSKPPMMGAGGGGGPSPLAGSPPPVGGAMRKGGKVEHKDHEKKEHSKHAKGGAVGGSPFKGSDSKARHKGMGAFK